MCGGGPTTTTGGTSSVSIPDWIKNAGKQNIKAAKNFANTWGKDTADETSAYGGIRDNSLLSEAYMPYQQGLISDLYMGGGMGEGADYIRDAYAQSNPAWQQYLQPGYLDPMSNPYLQPAIEAARSSAFNDVADRFHKAGRSFSGAESGAFGTAAVNSALPMLMQQYNTNVGAQQQAAQGILAGASGASGALDAAQGGILKAKMAAPQQIANLNIPENMLLNISDRQRAAALMGLNARIAALSGTPYGSTTTTSGASSVASDPFQTLLGGGLGLLGMFL